LVRVAVVFVAAFVRLPAVSAAVLVSVVVA
jgi:hypothetical protein